MLKTVMLLNIFVCVESFDKCKQHLFEIEMFCKVNNIFTVTFDHFNAHMLNKTVLPNFEW